MLLHYFSFDVILSVAPQNAKRLTSLFPFFSKFVKCILKKRNICLCDDAGSWKLFIHFRGMHDYDHKLVCSALVWSLWTWCLFTKKVHMKDYAGKASFVVLKLPSARMLLMQKSYCFFICCCVANQCWW